MRPCIARRPSASSVSVRSVRLSGRLQVDGLSAHHAVRAGRVGHDHDGCAACGAATAASRDVGLSRQQVKRRGLQAVAGENRDAVAVHDVQRRTAAPQRVVVHRRQVVVNERVGVNELDGAGRRQRGIPGVGQRVRRRVRTLRATASAAASVSTGRSRLPPAKTL